MLPGSTFPRQLLAVGLSRSGLPLRDTTLAKLSFSRLPLAHLISPTMKEAVFSAFALAAVVSAGSAATVGHSLASNPRGSMAPTQAVCLVAMAALAGTSAMCAAAAATDSQ